MNYRYILPCGQLEEYIDYYLVIESLNSEENEPVIVYPKPQTEMVFNYDAKTIEQIGSDAATHSNDWAISGFFKKKLPMLHRDRLV